MAATDTPLYEQILAAVSAGPWSHGLYLPGFSADSEPCIYGDERKLPLARLDAADEEAAANVVLMAAAWELGRELGRIVAAADAAHAATGPELHELHRACRPAHALLSRIHEDLRCTTVERYGKEEDEP
jgi:hypothetical protein